jgi:hypothetical protein
MKNTILNMTQWETRVNDWFSIVTTCKLSHADMLDRQSKFIDAEINRKWANGRRVYSSYMSGYIQGLITAKRSELFRTWVEFCYVDADGVIYSTWNKSDRRKTEEFYSSERGHLLNDMEHGHYWINSDKKF